MTQKKKSLGEALGALVATVVDAAISHCEAHKGTVPGVLFSKSGGGQGGTTGATPGGKTGAKPGGKTGAKPGGKTGPDPDGEVAWAIGVHLGCAPGNTGVAGQTMVNVSVPASYPNGVTLGAPQMTRMEPGKAIPTSSYQGTAPTHAPVGSSAILVSISANNPLGLYLGELRAMTSTGTAIVRSPVVIYLDGLP